MRAFTRVVYGIIDVQLLSGLHIGSGGDSAESDIAVDGDGSYILPATAIAGVSLHYIRDLQDERVAVALDLMGNPISTRKERRQESAVYFYDAICNDVQLEKRTGVGMDHARGVAESGRLFENYFLSPGMKAALRVQIFAADDTEVDTARWIIERIAQGYHSGKIAMGMRTSSGAGRFRVNGIKIMTLDLTVGKDRAQYLRGVEACYALAESDGESISVSDAMRNHADQIDTYVLQAYCPQGLIVKSGEKYPHSKGDRTDNLTVNMFYTMPQELNDEEPVLHYLIPGTAIKGILRTYAERVYSAMGLDTSELEYLFGNDPGSKEIKRKSCIRTFDTDLNGATPKVHHRIKIDRVLGSVMDGALLEEELLYINKKHPFELRVMIDYSSLSKAPNADVLRQRAEAIVFLAMRDLGTGRLTIGSGSSIGHGRLQGTTLVMNDAEFKIAGEQIDCGQQTADVEQMLRSLDGGAQ